MGVCILSAERQGFIFLFARRRSLIRRPGIAASIPRILADRSLRRRSADRRLAHFNPVQISASLQEAKLKTS